MSSVAAEIIIAIIALAGTICGSYFSNRKTAALLEYRLTQLEDKVHKHNNMIERTYRLEEATALQEAELKRVNERLKELEK